MRRLWLILLWVALVAGCRSDADYATLTSQAPEPTPSQEIAPATATPVFIENTPTPRPVDCVYSPVLRDGFCLLNANPALDGEPLNVEWEYRIRQEYPPGYQLYNLLEAENGLSGAEFYVDWIGITHTDSGYLFNIVSVASRAGFESEQIVIHYEQCVLVKATGATSIVNMESDKWNYSIGLLIAKQDGATVTRGWHPLPVSEPYAVTWAQCLSPGAYSFTAFIQAAYATALPGTEITIEAIAVGRDIDGDHCNLSTPKL